MSAAIADLTRRHPCYSADPRGKARIHLPVSPGCNLLCKFCLRKTDTGTMAPGVASSLLTPEEAMDVLRRAVKRIPEISVVGIAGPGDTLVTPYAIETLCRAGEAFPQLLKCMSTNGLLLEDKAAEVLEADIDALTVTVNAVNPMILAEICSGYIYKGKRRNDFDFLIRQQLKGIRTVAKEGLTVKVNAVLCPGINDGHIQEIAKAVKEAGARLFNVIPLIPQNALSHLREPGCPEVERTRAAVEEILPVFRHCMRCRADAVGYIGGEDISRELYGGKLIASENTFSHG
ncbi:MAG: radical SAM protein [Oscillospiraceae bacterium]|nr:radical SAM protein [Oscillospiraceae bacterium]